MEWNSESLGYEDSNQQGDQDIAMNKIDLENFIQTKSSFFSDDINLNCLIEKNSSNNNKYEYNTYKLNMINTNCQPVLNNEESSSTVCMFSKGEGDSYLDNKEEQPINSDCKGLSLVERMKKKKQKIKILLERKTKRKNQEKVENSEKENLIKKKEIKMQRNRLSAQRSRDRKKKEFEDLKILTKNLIKENNQLKEEINNKNNIIHQYQKTFKFLFNHPQNNYPNNTEIHSQESSYNPINIFSFPQKKLFILTQIFTFICIIGSVFSIPPKIEAKTIKISDKNPSLDNSNILVNTFQHKNDVDYFIIHKDYSKRNLLFKNKLETRDSNFLNDNPEISCFKRYISNINNNSLYPNNKEINFNNSNDDPQIIIHNNNWFQKDDDNNLEFKETLCNPKLNIFDITKVYK